MLVSLNWASYGPVLCQSKLGTYILVAYRSSHFERFRKCLEFVNVKLRATGDVQAVLQLTY